MLKILPVIGIHEYLSLGEAKISPNDRYSWVLISGTLILKFLPVLPNTYHWKKLKFLPIIGIPKYLSQAGILASIRSHTSKNTYDIKHYRLLIYLITMEDPNLSQSVSEFQEAGCILRIAFALSNSQHLVWVNLAL